VNLFLEEKIMKEKKEHQPKQAKKKASIASMLAQLEGIKFEPKELVDSWILLTYDLPATADGNKARYAFTKKAPKIGAVMHTKSVYLIPWSEQAEIAAFEVAKAGEAFLWTSTVADPTKKQEVTNFYDSKLGKRLDEIKNRIKRIKKHQDKNELRSANRMVKKTATLLNDIGTAISLRSSAPLLCRMVDLYKELVILSESTDKV
jgi:hypothetical protein